VRVYLDTNVLISALATRGLCADLLEAILADHDLLVGETVLKELQRVLSQKMHLAPKAVAELDAFLRRQGEVVHSDRLLRLKVRDPADRPILAEAVAGRAEMLVTGDRDLLVLAARAPIAIRSPREVWELLRSGETKGSGAS
jgi:putative PIN family toxin of toxin-antitoxin system